MLFSVENIGQSLEGGTILPLGYYRVAITEVDLKQTKSGNGDFFNLTFSIVGPEEFARRNIKARYTLNNKSTGAEVAMRIGRERFADLLYCVQYLKDFPSVEILRQNIIGKELLIETDMEAGQDGKEYSIVCNTWSLGGKHRNDKRNQDPLPKLGPNGKASSAKPRMQTTSARGYPTTSQTADLPF